MILYFSATVNCEHVAAWIAEETADTSKSSLLTAIHCSVR